MDNLRQSGEMSALRCARSSKIGVRSSLRSSKSVRAPRAPLFGAHSFNALVMSH